MSESSDTATAGGQIRALLFGRTDVGQIREHNEDNFLIADLTEQSRKLRLEDRDRLISAKGNVFGVCDGMGGAAAGEVASQMAVDLIYEHLIAQPAPESADVFAASVVRAVEEAGLKIYHEARADRSRRGMGTTATIAAVLGPRLFVAQVGDSRAYLLRGNNLVQVTRDQSLVNQLIEAGQLTEEEAETFEHNNIILQALGTAETVQVDVTTVELRRDDVLMVCSDGLSGMVRSPDLREVLLRVPDPVEACKELTALANAAGGHDNITVIVVRFSGDGLAESAPTEGVPFEKYAPGRERLTETVRYRVGADAETLQAAPPSEEAARETRELRVSHTMVGTLTPDLSELELSSLPGSRDETTPRGGLPPWAVLAVVITGLTLIGVLAVVLLR